MNCYSDPNYSPIIRPNNGNAAIFSGATVSQIQKYFMELTGVTEMPSATIIPGKGTIYVVKTPSGNFTLRDFASSSGQTGAAWTIDIPKMCRRDYL